MQPEPASAAAEWVRYDAVAEAYDRLMIAEGRALYGRLASDLVALVGPGPGDVVLDFGTGSGAAARVALDRVGPTGMVAGVDLSLSMLRVARRKGLMGVMAARVPGLPFSAQRFDAALGSLVMSHFECCETALADVVRVLKPGGRLGITAWAGSQTEHGRVWRAIAESFVGADALRAAAGQVARWEERFTDPSYLAEALTGVGLVNVLVQEHAYDETVTTAESLARSEIFTFGRYTRHALGADRWEHFCQAARAEIERQFGSRLHFIARAHVVVAEKPTKQEAPA